MTTKGFWTVAMCATWFIGGLIWGVILTARYS